MKISPANKLSFNICPVWKRPKLPSSITIATNRSKSFSYGVGQVEDEPEPEIGTPSYVSDEAVRSVRSQDFYYPEGLRTSVNYINKR